MEKPGNKRRRKGLDQLGGQEFLLPGDKGFVLFCFVLFCFVLFCFVSFWLGVRVRRDRERDEGTVPVCKAPR